MWVQSSFWGTRLETVPAFLGDGGSQRESQVLCFHISPCPTLLSYTCWAVSVEEYGLYCYPAGEK